MPAAETVSIVGALSLRYVLALWLLRTPEEHRHFIDAAGRARVAVVDTATASATRSAANVVSGRRWRAFEKILQGPAGMRRTLYQRLR